MFAVSGVTANPPNPGRISWAGCGRWCRHQETGNVQTAILDPIMEECLVSVDEECLLICIDWKALRLNGKLPDGAFLYYYTHYFFYYTHYLSWLNRIAAPVSASYALRFYAHPFCVLQRAYGTSGKLPIIIVTIIAYNDTRLF